MFQHVRLICMKTTQIPLLNPAEFDDYVFDTLVWKNTQRPFFNQFHVIHLEDYKKHLIIPQPPHRRSVTFFVFLTKGILERRKALTKYQIKAGSFFFLPAFQITSLDTLSDDAEGFYCHFSAEIFSNSPYKTEFLQPFSFLQLTGYPIVEVGNDQSAPFLQLFNRLLQINKTLTSDQFGLLASYLNTIFWEANQFVLPNEKPIGNAAARMTERFKAALSQHIYEKHTVSEFAELLSVSPNHLHKCVKAVTGKSAHDLLDEMRVLEAKVLLKQSGLSIADIAFKIGKLDPSDFSRFFKAETGQTPKEYRHSAY